VLDSKDKDEINLPDKKNSANNSKIEIEADKE